MEETKKKTALVTGASRGIGRAIAERLAKEGYAVAAIATKPSDASEKTQAIITESGGECSFFYCDVSDFAAAAACAAEVKEALGAPTVLVNNAGVTRDRLLLQMTEEDFDYVVSVNLKGAFNMTKAVIGDMVRARHGSVINISSVAGLMGNAGQINYASSKAGLIGFTKSLAREYARRGIRANAVCPGYIETDMTQALSESAREGLVSAVPLMRPGKPQDVAQAVAFLCEADYITGQILKVDGGMYM